MLFFRVLNQRNFDCRIEKEKLDNLQDLLCVHYNIAFWFSGLILSGQQSCSRAPSPDCVRTRFRGLSEQIDRPRLILNQKNL